jgi:hypothetical protein
LTHNSFSDLVLFAACAALAVRYLVLLRDQAGIGIACLLIGVAASLGVIQFSDWNPINELLRGPHRFASTLAAVGAFPVLAYSVAFPQSPISGRVSGAWWFAFVVGGLGFAVWLLGFKPWAQIVPALSGVWLAKKIVLDYRGISRSLGAMGLVFLFASFFVTLLIPASTQVLGIFTSVQLLHYFLAAALVLIALAAETAMHAGTSGPVNAPVNASQEISTQ